MNTLELTSISRLLEVQSLPSWLRDYLEENEEQVVSKLDQGICVDIEGPNGEIVTLRAAA